ncbi:TPA: hypothetical protein JG832_002524 [Enterobacter hormaechei subsp. xiangfangensis]|nr:hypothetical protein [Enterobacter hormaechei subsp. xiangfangensis]HAV1890659.1 hypothetical protein [Enterobacter hormaechei subsp. xiangfangensis]
MAEKPKSIKKIAVLTTSGRDPLFVQAIDIDGALTLDVKERLPRQGDKMAAMVLPKLTRLVNAGFMVLVDEVSGRLGAASGANSITLDAKHHDGRPVIVVAMERYKELQRQGMISFQPGEEGLFSLPPSIVDTEVKPNGEAVYRINWDEIKGEHLLTLFCVYGSFYNNTASVQYLNALCGTLVAPPDVLTPFHNIVRGTETKVLNQGYSTSSLTGKRLPNGDKVL